MGKFRSGTFCINTIARMDAPTHNNLPAVAEKPDAPKTMKSAAPKTKKPAAPKTKRMPKTAGPAAHPKYSDMVVTAIQALKSRTGSSRQAILKHVIANNNVNADQASNHVKLAIKKGLDKGILRATKDSGKGAGSFKITEDHKQTMKDQEKRAKKVATKKAVELTKKAGKVTKKVAKKASKVAKKVAKKPTAKKVAKKPAAKKIATKKQLKKPVKKVAKLAPKKMAKTAVKKAAAKK